MKTTGIEKLDNIITLDSGKVIFFGVGQGKAGRQVLPMQILYNNIESKTLLMSKRVSVLDSMLAYESKLSFEKKVHNLKYDFTEEERVVGVKLNCLSVVMHPGVSRTFFLDEFKDIGGIYLKHLTTSEGYQALIYFESCTPAELEEKLNTVKTMSVVASANKIHVYAYYGTAFAE
jgi:hypothetical protein